MALEADQQLLHYRLIDKIGEGGMGQVWLALDTRLQRKVAVKVPSAKVAGNEVDLRRFKHEAQAAAAIDHPFVCKVYEVGHDRDVDFIAMEYVEGATLSHELKLGALPLERALRLAEEMLEALAVAHERGIVHRDLKPDNVMLAGGHVKVMDFGLAVRGSQSSGPDADTVTRLTRAGATVGTIPYMSPEQLRGGDVDPRSDLFALGVMLQEMLTGIHPFQRTTSADTSAAILNEPAGSLQASNPELPARLQPVLDRLLAKNRDSRFASAAEALNELRDVRAAESAVTAPETSRRSKTPLMIVLLAIAIIAASLATWALLGARGRERARALFPEIQKLAEAGDYVEAYRLAEKLSRSWAQIPSSIAGGPSSPIG
jgi:serine/threonine-protein kinase